MKVIGITGGIGSGKSTVSAMLKNAGFSVIDADKIAREILISEGGNELIAELSATFGDFIIKNGILDRKELAKVAFANAKEKEKLDAIMLPAIIRKVKMEISDFEKQNMQVVFLDAPLLFEAGLDVLCTETWLIHASESIRVLRTIKRDNVSENDVRMRMRFQMSDEQKIEMADFVIDNSKDEEYLKKQIKLRLKESVNL